MEKNGKKNIFAEKNGKKLMTLRDRLAAIKIEDKGEAREGYLKGLFLIKRIEIEEALREGFGKKWIWEILNRDGEFPGSYSSFLKMVKKYIEEPLKAQTQKVQEEEKKSPPIEKKKFEPQPIRHFIHNPNIGDDW